MDPNSKPKTLQQLRRRVKTLQKKPQPEQRTPEWFKQRQTRITASEAASCLFKSQRVCEPYVCEFSLSNFKYKDTEPLNPYETKEDYIIKKCSAFYGESVFRDNPATLWGKKYEEVANRLYHKLTNKNVFEFGLLSHSRLKWLAASPDGITEDGIMLEIKCPKSRKIDPCAPPLYYWIQVQIQLESTDLEFCDFLECEIEEIPTETEFLGKIPLDQQDIGIILQIADSGSDPKFIYPPVDVQTHQQYITWKNTTVEQTPQALVPIYFVITKYNVIRIKRSREWFAAVKDDIKQTWDFIMKLQSNLEDFQKYKDSIYRLKNRAFLERWTNTQCLIIGEDTEFEFDIKTSESIKCDDGIVHPNASNIEMVHVEQESVNVECLIDTTE
uniref:YqaJ viral recombinase domain-containing protein n=1 Tax=viral metagenome TaxID=1070528 RepID=A0A6C0H739_9ZZZZ